MEVGKVRLSDRKASDLSPASRAPDRPTGRLLDGPKQKLRLWLRTRPLDTHQVPRKVPSKQPGQAGSLRRGQEGVKTLDLGEVPRSPPFSSNCFFCFFESTQCQAPLPAVKPKTLPEAGRVPAIPGCTLLRIAAMQLLGSSHLSLELRGSGRQSGGRLGHAIEQESDSSPSTSCGLPQRSNSTPELEAFAWDNTLTHDCQNSGQNFKPKNDDAPSLLYTVAR